MDVISCNRRYCVPRPPFYPSFPIPFPPSLPTSLRLTPSLPPSTANHRQSATSLSAHKTLNRRRTKEAREGDAAQPLISTKFPESGPRPSGPVPSAARLMPPPPPPPQASVARLGQQPRRRPRRPHRHPILPLRLSPAVAPPTPPPPPPPPPPPRATWQRREWPTRHVHESVRRSRLPGGGPSTRARGSRARPGGSRAGPAPAGPGLSRHRPAGRPADVCLASAARAGCPRPVFPSVFSRPAGRPGARWSPGGAGRGPARRLLCRALQSSAARVRACQHQRPGRDRHHGVTAPRRHGATAPRRPEQSHACGPASIRGKAGGHRRRARQHPSQRP